MGYSSTHRLTWKETATHVPAPMCSHGPPTDAKFCPECGKPNGFLSVHDLLAIWIARKGDDIAYCIMPDGTLRNSGMWRDYVTDLRELTRLIPGVIFHLSRVGEEPGDITDTYALDGKVQEHRARVVRVLAPDPTAWT